MSLFENEGNEGRENEGNEHGGAANGSGTLVQTPTAGTPATTVQSPVTSSNTNLTLYGREGDHELHGGNGDDTLVGSGGNLLLAGGSGTNTFNVQAGEDTLADAKPGQDHINIASGATAVQNLTLTSADYSANTANSGTLVINAPQTSAATITGSSGHDEIHGGADNDEFHGSAGNDTIDGGAGINTAVYSTNSANISIAPSGGSLIVQDTSGVNGTDTLTNVQRLQFADTKIAMDIDGHAGMTAKILGAVFGAASVSNATYAGIGLSHLDSGTSYESLMQLALNAAGATTSTAEVDLLWSNLFGAAPTAAQAAPYIAMLDSGASTAAAVGVMAADTSINAANINLVGLHATGLHYA